MLIFVIRKFFAALATITLRITIARTTIITLTFAFTFTRPTCSARVPTRRCSGRSGLMSSLALTVTALRFGLALLLALNPLCFTRLLALNPLCFTCLLALGSFFFALDTLDLALTIALLALRTTTSLLLDDRGFAANDCFLGDHHKLHGC
jgi:hypothetical protein